MRLFLCECVFLVCMCSSQFCPHQSNLNLHVFVDKSEKYMNINIERLFFRICVDISTYSSLYIYFCMCLCISGSLFRSNPSAHKWVRRSCVYARFLKAIRSFRSQDIILKAQCNGCNVCWSMSMKETKLQGYYILAGIITFLIVHIAGIRNCYLLVWHNKLKEL